LANPLQLLFSMILLILRMKILSEKRVELSQTIAYLSVSTRMEVEEI